MHTGTFDGAIISRLAGVYNADGTVRGEISYWVAARVGRAHCALCDITHGLVRERTDWQTCRVGLPVPFDTYHRNDQPDHLRNLLADRVPGVVAETDHGPVLLLGPDELDACTASPERLIAALVGAATRLRLTWPNAQPGRPS